MLTVEQVVALAPDTASMHAGQGLAGVASWTTIGRDAVLLWGDCRGSGRTPYHVTIEHATTEYACTCPSRKFPCKHVLALLLLAAAGAVPAGTAPDRALAWFVQREQKRKAKQQRVAVAVAATAPADDDVARDAAARKRAAAREGRVAAGLDELERWLFDVVRLGIASVQHEPPAFWHAKAARLVDAQAPGLARRVRAIADGGPAGRSGTQRLLASLGSLYALRTAYARIDRLTPERRADVRRQIGFTQREDEALLRPGATVADRWTVVGARSDDEERVVAHRAWLFGERTGRFALVLQFVVPGAQTAPLALGVPAGSAFDGTLAYFEAAVPQRAALARRDGNVLAGAYPRGETVAEMLGAYASDVAADPWFVTAPVRLAIERIVRLGDGWFAADAKGAALPLAAAGHDPFVLLALCGDRPLTLYAEWNGEELLPLGAVADGRFVRLT